MGTDWDSFKKFISTAFSENGTPSSSRILSAWLSVSSMALIWFCIKHMMQQPADKLAIWIGGLPMIIGALATFAVSPYGIMKFTGIWGNKNDNGVKQ